MGILHIIFRYVQIYIAKYMCLYTLYNTGAACDKTQENCTTCFCWCKFWQLQAGLADFHFMAQRQFPILGLRVFETHGEIKKAK